MPPSPRRRADRRRLLAVHDSLQIIGGGERVFLRLAARSGQHARVDLVLLSSREAALDVTELPLRRISWRAC